MKKAKRWWFAAPLPAVLLILYVTWLLRIYVGVGTDCFFGRALAVAAIGLAYFPVGLFGALGVPVAALTCCFWLYVIVGYVLYVALSVVGVIKRSWKVLVVLVLMLSLNAVGCQLDRTCRSTPLAQRLR
jgi:hypothetical protein